MWARQPLHPHSTKQAKGLRLCSHSHFGQQLPLPELIPLLFSQLLSLACLDQLQPPLDFIFYTVHLPEDKGSEGWCLPHRPSICLQPAWPSAHRTHHLEHPGPISCTLVHSDPLVGHGLAEAHLATGVSLGSGTVMSAAHQGHLHPLPSLDPSPGPYH